MCGFSVYGHKACGRYLFVILPQPDTDIIKLRNGIRRFEIFYIWAAVFLPYRHLCLQTTSPRRLPPSGQNLVLRRLGDTEAVITLNVQQVEKLCRESFTKRYVVI